MEPAQKKRKTDGDISFVSPDILEAAKDIEKWIAERRKNWPTRERVAARAAANPDATPDAGDVAKPNLQSAKVSTKSNSSPQSRPVQTRICRFYVKGNCRAGNRCRFAHQKESTVPKRYEPPPKASLFLKLVQSDHDVEDELLLDFIYYLSEKGRLKH